MSKARDIASAIPAPSTVDATELGYLDGVTSAIQTQIDTKAPSSTAVTLTGTQTLTNKTLTNPVIASVVNNTLTSTTGDMIYASAANTPARLGIGSSAQVLTVAAGVPSWATPAGGGGMTLLSTTSLSGTSVTISSIDQTYKHLLIIGRDISVSTSGDNIGFRLNGDTAANYQNHTLYLSSTTPGGSYNTNDSTMQFIGSATTGTGGFASSQIQMDIYRYAETEYKKINYTSARGSEFTIGAGRYNSTTAISSVTFSNGQTFNAGTIYIYGVK